MTCCRGDLLGRRVLGELNALGNVALEAVVAGLEELLLVVVGAADDIDGLLGTAGAKLDGNREELGASGLCNSIAALNTGKVHEAGLDKTLFALGGPDDLVGESTDVSCELLDHALSSLTGNRRRPWREWRNQHHPLP
jgi:hypothetical protein